MTIFRIISGTALLIFIGAVAFDLKRRRGSWNAAMEYLRGGIKSAARIRQERRLVKSGHTITVVRTIVYLIAVLSFLLLALTGFAPILFAGNHPTGILLLIHVTVAPVFALALAAASLLWAHSLRFDNEDWRVVRNGHRGLREESIRFALKAGFWLILLLSLPLMLTVILGLFPLFGTEGETFLIQLHGYSALFLMLVALFHLYLTITYAQQPSDQFVKE
jgi:cytochrome b subunit of formate dehydrogenase